MSIVQDAINKALATSTFTEGMCDYFTGVCYGQSETGYDSAAIHWNSIPAQYKHPGDQNPPAGAVCFYQGGSHGYGHAAISLGNGKIRSTDMDRNGQYRAGNVNTVDLNAPSNWGYGQHYVGWAEPFYNNHLIATIGADTKAIDMNYPKGYDWAAYQVDHPTPGDFVFIKATEGLHTKDAKYDAHVAWARQNHEVVGHYVFLDAHEDATSQAKWFEANISYQPGDIIAIDWEQAGSTQADRDAALKELKAKYPESQVGVYCNINFWTHIDTESNPGDFLWLAWPGQVFTAPIHYNYLFHQNGVVNGVDVDYARFVDVAHLKAWATAKVKVTPAPVKPAPAPAPKPTVSAPPIKPSAPAPAPTPSKPALPAPADQKKVNDSFWAWWMALPPAVAAAVLTVIYYFFHK